MPGSLSKQEALELIRGGRARTWSAYRRSNPDWLPDLSGEHLGNAKIASFDLSGADLCGADLSGAILFAGFSRVKLTDARYDLHTKFPRGVSPEDYGAVLVPRVDPTMNPEPSRDTSVARKRILFLAADPRATTLLQLDKEAREINAKIRAAEYRDSLELITRWAVRPDDLQQSLLETKPHVLHFSGHGSPQQTIVLVDNQDQPKDVSKEALRQLLSVLTDNLRLVVLNACYSRPQAEAITKSIDAAIGMKRAIGDEAAIVFAGSFYRALGFGRSVQEAFELGVVALLMEGGMEHSTPELLVRQGVDASKLHVVGSPV